MSVKGGYSDKYKTYLDSAMKYDQFIAAALLASSAYLAQTIKFAPLKYDFITLQLISLLLVSFSTFCAFQRMDRTVKVIRFEILRDINEGAARANAERWAKSYVSATNWYAKGRNILMLAGGLCFLVSKIWGGYVQVGVVAGA